MASEGACAAPAGRGLGCQLSAEEEAAGSVRCEARGRVACGGSSSGGLAVWVRLGAGPPGPVLMSTTLGLLLSGVGLVRISEDIVVGCGGFVKSDVEINYSLIEVSARPAAPAGTLLYDPSSVTQPLWAAVAFVIPGGCHQPHSRVLSSLKVPLPTGSAPFPSRSRWRGRFYRGLSYRVRVGGLRVRAQGCGEHSW